MWLVFVLLERRNVNRDDGAQTEEQPTNEWPFIDVCRFPKPKSHWRREHQAKLR